MLYRSPPLLVPPVVAQFMGASNINAQNTTYSFTSMDLGPPRENRVVVFAFMSGTNLDSTVSSATIDGVTATKIAETHDAALFVTTTIMAAVVNTKNRTGTIAVTINPINQNAASCSVYSLWNCGTFGAAISQPAVAGTSSSVTCSLVSIPPRSVIIMAAHHTNTASTGIFFDKAFKDNEIVPAANNRRDAVAHTQPLMGGALSIIASCNVSENGFGAAAASFSP
jgi:hypothetical protein